MLLGRGQRGLQAWGFSASGPHVYPLGLDRGAAQTNLYGKENNKSRKGEGWRLGEVWFLSLTPGGPGRSGVWQRPPAAALGVGCSGREGWGPLGPWTEGPWAGESVLGLPPPG